MKIPIDLLNSHKELSTHPLVEYLLDLTEKQSQQIEQLKSEIRLLKGHSAKPAIRPNSNLEGVKSKSLNGVKKNASQ